ncbi:peptide deformylase [Streptomyces brasiliensis]|uniref:Peptide deformylase n=1 Tax=Streptomyces brasiliensis TaxID=1954 RepID=A0A917L0U9_9ACTN|nr:peptide deformylase [Streptomyces brasiliensis]GGJ39620.1 peptide deformylase 1 [Streptomyces brasiliensis]
MGSTELTDKAAQLLEKPGPLSIIQAGDPVLRQKTDSYDGQLDDDMLQRLIARMRETMEQTHGAVGLAAPQVGLPLRLAVLATPAEFSARLIERGQQPVPFTVLVNPSYKAVGRPRTASFEGCLSVAGWQAVVARPDRIRLDREDETGQRLVEEHAGLGARIMQHETDHLDGMLHLDRAELRSLSTAEQVVERWGAAGLATAAEQLGFPLP